MRFLLAIPQQLTVWSVSLVPPRMSCADHRGVDVVAFRGVVELANHAPVTIGIDLDDVDAGFDHAL